MSTVVVVDDDERVCRALERSLRTNGYKVRTYTRARDYLAERSEIDASCIVADINMPELDGLDMHREECADGVGVPTVFITGHIDVQTAVRAMKEGALDLLEKPFELSLLLETVAAAVARGHLEREDRDALVAVWERLELLTPREAEVCALVASGRLNKQIAALIGTGEKTVKVHRARVMLKLGVHSVAELVRLVDRVLAAPPALPLGGARGRLQPPPAALAYMASALGTASRLWVRPVTPRPRSVRRVAENMRAFAEQYALSDAEKSALSDDELED